MRIFLVPLKVVVEQMLGRFLSKSPVSQRLLTGFGTELHEATELDARILGGATRLGCYLQNLLKQCLSGSIALSVAVEVRPRMGVLLRAHLPVERMEFFLFCRMNAEATTPRLRTSSVARGCVRQVGVILYGTCTLT